MAAATSAVTADVKLRTHVSPVTSRAPLCHSACIDYALFSEQYGLQRDADEN